MTNETMQLILEDIRRIEEKIQDINYLEQFDVAKKFTQRLSIAKQKLLNKDNNSVGIDENEASFIKDIVGLEFEIDNFLNQKGKEIQKQIDKNEFENKVSGIVTSKSEKSTQELWQGLASIIDEYSKKQQSEMDNMQVTKKVAEAALKILKLQAAKGETIDINAVEQCCSKEDLIEAIQEELISLAQKQEGTDRRRSLDIAKSLTVQNLEDRELWQKLTNVDNVKIASLESEQEDEITEETVEDNQSAGTLAVIEPKVSFVDKFSKFLHSELRMSTLYTFGDINPETGEWENVKVVRSYFPKKMSKRQKDRVLAIQINDVPHIQKGTDFRQFEQLQKVEFGRGVKEIYEIYGDMNEIITGEDVRKIGESAFEGCRNLRKVSLGKNITYIGPRAFKETNIQEITIPGGILEINQDTFWGCWRLRKVIIQDGVEIIRESAFKYSGIESIIIPDSISWLKGEAFMGCGSLTNVNLGKGLAKISEYTFATSGLESIVIPGNIKVVENAAFWNCYKLTKVTMEEGLEEIGDDAFYETGIEELVIPDSVEKLNACAFAKCIKLKNATIGKGIKSIGGFAFSKCEELQNVTMRNRFTEIGWDVFEGTKVDETSIKYVTIEKDEQENSKASKLSTQYVPIKKASQSPTRYVPILSKFPTKKSREDDER